MRAGPTIRDTTHNDGETTAKTSLKERFVLNVKRRAGLWLLRLWITLYRYPRIQAMKCFGAQKITNHYANPAMQERHSKTRRIIRERIYSSLKCQHMITIQKIHAVKWFIIIRSIDNGPYMLNIYLN